MNAALQSMMFLSALLLLSCEGEGTSREEARIQREVDQRVAVIRKELQVSEKRWNTARTVALCALAGGALLWLLNDKGGASSSRQPESRPRIPQDRTRMIEHPDGQDDDEYDPYRR